MLSGFGQTDRRQSEHPGHDGAPVVRVATARYKVTEWLRGERDCRGRYKKRRDDDAGVSEGFVCRACVRVCVLQSSRDGRVWEAAAAR